MSLVVAGMVAIDNVRTPDADHSELLGGSAAYASLAASLFTEPVYLVSIVGQDFPQRHFDTLSNQGVDLSAVEQAEGQSFTWSGEYSSDLNVRSTTALGLGVFENWTPKIPAQVTATTGCVVLANMSPRDQHRILDLCPDACFTIADTMEHWITGERALLDQLLRRIDLLILNESEAQLFTGSNNTIRAGEQLARAGSRWVVVKLGEYGSLLFGREGELFRCGAYPLRQAVDPTGAGDCFLGGLAGYLDGQAVEEPTSDDLRQAMMRGAVAASFTCEAFSTRGVEQADRVAIDDRVKQFVSIHSTV